MTDQQARDLVAILRTVTVAVVGHAQLGNSGMCPFCHVEGYRGSGDMTLRTGTGHRETCPITLLAQRAKELGRVA